jgi:hypothetical protein
VDDLLNHDRVTRAKRNYSKMKLASVSFNQDRRGNSNIDDLAERGRRRMMANQEKKKQKQIEFI